MAAELGLHLDPWQAWVLEQSLGERPDGRWAAMQVCLLCPRQNGKGSILEARELAGLFLFGEKKITHSAHEAKTAKDHFERLENLLRDAGYGDDLVEYRRSTTEVSITLRSTKCKLHFYTRTPNGGRGLAGDVGVLDEAFALNRDQMAALMPTMSARSLNGNPQMWFTSSAGFAESEVLAQKKVQGEAGYDRLAYFDWSAEPGSILTDRDVWAKANPGLGLRISEDFIADELPDLGPEGFGRERLGLWHEFSKQRPISLENWRLTEREIPKPVRPPAFFITMARKHTTITAAVMGEDFPHVEVSDHRFGDDWLTARAKQLRDRYPGAGFAAWRQGPVKAWEPEFEREAIPFELFSQPQEQAACTHTEKLVENKELTHFDRFGVLDDSLEGAQKRDLPGGAWVLDWDSSTGNPAPVAGVIGALWLLETSPGLPMIF